MTVECPECGAKFDTERGLEIHREIDHRDVGIEREPEDDVFDHLREWWTPRNAFLLGGLAGILVLGLLVLSSPTTFGSGEPEDVGAKTLAHYRSAAPPGVEYDLVDVREDVSGMYRVTLEVTSGTATSQETVYVAPDGRRVFESPPVQLHADISAFSDGQG